MTANQLTFQRNQIAQQEADIEAKKALETERANKMRENLTLQELGQKAIELSQRERDMRSKYGPYQYYSENEETGGAKDWFNMIRRGFEYVINPVLSIFSGGKSK